MSYIAHILAGFSKAVFILKASSKYGKALIVSKY